MPNYEKLTKVELIKTLQSFNSTKRMKEDDREQLLHELQVHQIELEMQNQELREMQQQLEETGNLFADLYDFAPVGYISLNDNGFIQEINLTGAAIIGLERSYLINMPFASYITQSDLGKFCDHLRKCGQTKERVTTQISLLTKESGLFQVELSSVAIYDTKRPITLYRTAFSDITERKQTEEALQVQTEKLNTAYQELQHQADAIREHAEASERARDEAERRTAELEAIIASITAGVIIYDNLGNVIRINEFAANTFGSSSNDDNAPYQERLERSKLCKSDDVPYEKEEAPLYRALRGEPLNDEEIMITKVSGEPVWLSAIFAPIRDSNDTIVGVILIFTDITERKRKAETILASERELLKVTLNSLGEGVVVIDQDDRIIFINETATNLTGYSQNEAIGETVYKILYMVDDKTSEPIDKIPPRAALSQLVLVTRDLTEVVISLNSASIKATDGQIIGEVIVFQDITEKQRTEQELLRAAKLDSLGILAGGVAHDFNNILAGILANLQLAAIKLKKHQDISKHLEDTIEISRKASNLTKQLLTFAKGGDPVKKAAAIAKLVMETVLFALSGSKSKAEFHLPEDLWVVDVDEGQITQVINNLIINADQAMPIGGNLEIYGENVTFEATGKYHPGQYVKLTIKDHGIGIPAEILNKIYDPFFTTKKTGNGLGLSTSYSIIKKHNGYLEVESAPGIGTAFYIYLPVSLEELTFKETQKEIAAGGEAKILLMDDEDAVRNAGGEILACFGYRVTLARDGQEAVDLYKQAKETGEPFDVVIMDLTIPGGLGGIETMAILRQIDPQIKAVISSGYASDPVTSDYERYGFSGVVIKPYKFEELSEVLNKVIDRKQLPLDFSY